MRASSLLKAAVIGGLCFVGSLAQDGNMPTHIPLQLNKNLELELATDADATYFLETSSDLENWSFAGSYKVGDGALHRQLIDPDGEEFFYKYFTAPTNFAKPDDTDGDGIPNTWELNNDLNPTDEDEDANGQNDGLDDSDSDGLSNQAESLIGTSLSEPDSDGNGISDYDDMLGAYIQSENENGVTLAADHDNQTGYITDEEWINFHPLGASGDSTLNNQNTIVVNSSTSITSIWLDTKAGIRNDQTTDNNPNYQKVIWNKAWGDSPPITLNAQMQGRYLYGRNRLWQNGHWYEVEAEGYSDIETYTEDGGWKSAKEVNCMYSVLLTYTENVDDCPKRLRKFQTERLHDEN